MYRRESLSALGAGREQEIPDTVSMMERSANLESWKVRQRSLPSQGDGDASR